MKYFNKIYFGSLMLFPMATMAEGGVGGVIRSITSNLSAVPELLALLLIIFGMYCIYQLVMTFTNRDEGSRDYPMKNVPFYFIGAALGIGAMAFSGVVQKTLYGDSTTDTSGAGTDIWKTSSTSAKE